MLRLLQKAAWLALFWCLVIGFGFAVWSASQHSPPHNRGQPAKAEEQHSSTRHLIADPIADKKPSERKKESEWYSVFSEHIPEWLIAFFNGLLVYVTYRLVTTTGDLRLATDKLWEAGERQIAVAQRMAEIADLSARAAIRLELPVIHSSDPELISVSGPVDETGWAGATLHGLPFQNCVISDIEFRNDGRTPAFPISFVIGFAVTQVVPKTPVYLRTIRCPPGSIIKPNDKWECEINFELAFTGDELRELKENSTLWVWCYLSYENFMRGPETEYFAWRWGKEPQDAMYYFIPLNRPLRNYITD